MDGDTRTRGRQMRDAARRYMESLEAERTALTRRIAELERTVDEQARHHAGAHADCAAGKMERTSGS